jgi:hypothetical protein
MGSPVLGVAVVLAGALTAGAWTHLTQYRLSADAAEQEREFVPQVRVASVEPSCDIEVVKLPATTSAFASANIFARSFAPRRTSCANSSCFTLRRAGMPK